jgi:hypothetical protein
MQTRKAKVKEKGKAESKYQFNIATGFGKTNDGGFGKTNDGKNY